MKKEDLISELKPITWKVNHLGGGATAFCGEIKIGWVKKSLAGRNIYYPTVLNDVVRLKKQSYPTLEESKEAVEKSFKQVITLMFI